jgi:hypothetical protein
MKKIKISQNDLKLLLILLALVVLGVTYQFIYKNNLEKIETVNTEIQNLSTQLSEITVKQEDQDSMLEENKRMKQQIDNIMDSFGKGATEEKYIMFVKGLEEAANMDICTIHFSEPEYFFSASKLSEDKKNRTKNIDPVMQEDASPTEIQTTNEKDSKVIPITNGSNELEVDVTTPYIDINSLSGYKSTITIDFKVNYSGLKKCIEYINNYPEKTNIGEITLSFDSETGNLIGLMTIRMYHLIGAGRLYTEPTEGGMEIGTNNIFGTIEIPIQ